MTDSRRLSPFTDLAAVEAWDAWFRWREQADLRDFSIEDTWGRVAGALVAAEAPDEASLWKSRLIEAFASWRLLPDEHLLASAGTNAAGWPGHALSASLNAAAFVIATCDIQTRIDHVAVMACAQLAVRMLDNALRITGAAVPHLRIGIVGMADALLLLGLDYDSDRGRRESGAFVAALCEGCLRGNILLAHERGASRADIREALARASRRNFDPELLRDAECHGLRHASLTAVTSQPRLALLANDVADAVDPLLGENHAHVIAAADGQCTVCSSGYALNILRAQGGDPDDTPGMLANLPWTAQIAMRAALQPWMDEPITYPLLATNDLGDSQRLEARKLAAAHGLCEPVWRAAARSQRA